MTFNKFSSLSIAVTLLFFSTLTSEVYAQSVGISDVAITPNTNSILEIEADDKGVLLPRISTAVRDINLTGLGALDAGLTIFNTTLVTYQFWNGSAWVDLATTANVSSSSLNDAYNAGGAGLGRVITADNGAVDIQDAGGLLVNGITGIGTSSPDADYALSVLKNISNSVKIAGASLGLLVEVNAGSEDALSARHTSTANTQAYYAVKGEVTNESGVGYLGYHSSGDDSYGVYGQSGTYAGYFDGDVNMTGELQLNGSAGTSGQVLMSAGPDADAVWSTAAGDIESITAGEGLLGGGTTGDITLDVDTDNGLNVDAAANKIQLGGDLTEATEIQLETFDLTLNLNGTGEFIIQDGGADHLKVQANGDAIFGSDTYFKDTNTGGTDLVKVSDAGTDGNDGRIEVYANGVVNHTIHGDGNTVFNDQNFDRDFNIKSLGSDNTFYLDAGNDRIGIGTDEPSAKLEVYDEAAGSTMMIRVTKNSNVANELVGIGLGSQVGASLAKSAIVHERESANGTGKLHFLVDDAVDAADVTLAEARMTIDRNGLVGIGETAPTERLDVNGQIRMQTGATIGYIPVSDANGVMTWTDPSSLNGDFIQNQNAADQTADFRISGDGSILKGLTMGDGITIDNDNLNAGTVSTQSLAFGNASGEAIGSKRTAGGNQNGLDFFTANAARISIENAGHVGINNTAPSNPLHVVGLSTSDFDVARFDGSSTFGAGLRLNSTGTGGRAWTMISTANSAGEGAGKLLFKDETGGNVLMTIENGGNVGIGTTGPAAKLDVAGTIALNDNALRLRGGGDGNHYLAYVGGSFDGPKLNGNSSVVLSTNTGGLGGNDLVVNNGRIGINIAAPTQGLLHVNGFYNNNAGNFAYYAVGGSGCSGGGCSGAADVSIYASNRIQASEFNAYSDARIKNVHSITKGAEDIQTIMGIEITNYTKIDQRSGKGMEKKVIAQQVEEVYPQAVSKGVDVIPNIYKLSNIKEGRINVANELAAGSKVRLIFEDRTTLTEVLTADSDGFTVALEDQGQVFVYGEEVSDFRSVDYEAISMLNISATQELYKMIQNLQQENAEVKAELGRIDVLSSELEEIKASLGIGLQSAK